MNTKHTPEPWRAGCDDEETEEANVIMAGNIVVARVEDDEQIRRKHNKGKVEKAGSTAAADSLDEVDANARRIVACVNALAGLNPEAVKDVVDEISNIAFTCEMTKCSTAGDGDAMLKAVAADLRAALAKLKP